jgi:predicted secreted protein
MAFVAGKDSAITIDSTDLTSYVDSMSLSRDINTLTVTSFGDDNEAYISGVQGFSMDISGSFDATADSAIAGMFDGATVTFDFRPNNSTGAPKYTGSALITNYTIDSSAGDKVSFSASLLVSGAITRGTVA